MTDEKQNRDNKEFMQMLGVLDMIYEMQVTALEGMTRGSYKEMEEGIKKVEVLQELQQRGILPYRKDK
ncbi:MAG: hypothetical protein WC781_04640 [Candidatus Pacearchaeota archaeon]|jgi:hypothetical protein